ncbi:MAG: YggS family pyridoxal phosphate-dependent enzyme, partial [Desulfovibrionales bacterium]|nr:YggS family pyridoxal phosphate-dependent enzyme [Desulfovibrionales bacterium]
MDSIKNNLSRIKTTIHEIAKKAGRAPEEVQLIGVSKRKTAETVLEGIDAGADHLGENYIQEAIQKIDTIGKSKACWHFIGHLQSNKAKFAVPFFDYIHTVHSIKLAKEINKQAAKVGKIQNILLQVNIGNEDSKSGAHVDQAIDLAKEFIQFPHLKLCGLMCMPPFSQDPEEARPYFKRLAALKQDIIKAGIPLENMNHLSMGMSNDFAVAIEEGATFVRVGTAI